MGQIWLQPSDISINGAVSGVEGLTSDHFNHPTQLYSYKAAIEFLPKWSIKFPILKLHLGIIYSFTLIDKVSLMIFRKWVRFQLITKIFPQIQLKTQVFTVHSLFIRLSSSRRYVILSSYNLSRVRISRSFLGWN